MEEYTPMMRQYLGVKEQYKDAILFFRLGDFYEMFFEDAVTASKELEITLTGKDCGTKERAPMCGVPFHAADTYIARLVSKGYKVAICEQAEDPKSAKGIVKREVIRVVTPGTILDEGLLSYKSENYMCSLYKEGDSAAITFCDLSTGKMLSTWFEEDKSGHKLIDEMARFAPVEIIYNIEIHKTKDIRDYIEGSPALGVLNNDVFFDKEFTAEAVKTRFSEKAKNLNHLMVCATGALLSYLCSTQHMEPRHITEIEIYESAQFMDLDMVAQRNLELTETMYEKSKRGSLLWVLDDTETTMGARILKSWLARPLLNCAKIGARHIAVTELCHDMGKREELRDEFRHISDIERVTGRIVMGSANARDMIKLKSSFGHLPDIKRLMQGFQSTLLLEQYEKTDVLEDLCDLIERAINDDPPMALRDGDIIKEGFSEELDELRRARDGGGKIIAEIEQEERERTDIKNLKIRFNKVFGYFIEVSKANADRVPEDYIRKQTLVNGERYITPKLKEVENVVLGAAEKITALEYSLFQDVRNRIAAEVERILTTADAIGVTDCLLSLATVAVKNNYCCPKIDMSDNIEIRDGRHPVVEKVLKDTLFAPNDTHLDTKDNRLAIITGPNMAGKSTYMRQIALITIMAQMGSFVPAAACDIGLVDKIFTRVGASDDLSSGRSTFMVEMSEVADILKNATGRSLLILDEIGRGTSTYDGLSIAWSVLEYCTSKLKAKTLFATHYHELTQLEDKLDGVINYSIAVKKRGDDIIFLRKIVRGGADESYGVEVAKIAGVPDVIIERAKKILRSLESGDEGIKITGRKVKKEENTGQMGFETMGALELVDELKKIDANTLSPIEALNILFGLTRKAKEL